MRDIEKGVLLAEMFNADTSKYVPSFIEWVKNTDQYRYFISKRENLNVKRTWKARRFLAYFNSIDIDDCETIKDVMIEYGKICYLVKIASEPSYTNPLIIQNLDMINMTIGDIKLMFDGKLITLKELSKLEGFSFERKEEVIKEKIENWINEVEDSIMKPLEEFKVHNFYFPAIKIMSKFRTFELIYLLLINALFLSVYFIKIPLFEKIVSDSSSLSFCIYLICFGFIFVYDIVYIITMLLRVKRYGYYSKARQGIFDDIYKQKEKCELKLRTYIYSQLATYGDMDALVSDFSKISKYYPYIGYLRKRLSMKKRIRVDSINIGEIIGFIVSILCVIALAIMIIL